MEMFTLSSMLLQLIIMLCFQFTLSSQMEKWKCMVFVYRYFNTIKCFMCFTHYLIFLSSNNRKKKNPCPEGTLKAEECPEKGMKRKLFHDKCGCPKLICTGLNYIKIDLIILRSVNNFLIIFFFLLTLERKKNPKMDFQKWIF